jgi:catalase
MTSLKLVKDGLERAGACGKIVANRLGVLAGNDGEEALIDFSLLTTSSVLFDAVYVPGGKGSIAALLAERDALEFVTEAYRHCKPIAATSDGVDLLRACPAVLIESEENGNGHGQGDSPSTEGVIVSGKPASAALVEKLLNSLAEHRFWNRTRKNVLRGDRQVDESRGRAQTPTVTGTPA